MKSFWPLLAAGALCAALANAQPPARPRYSVRDLGTFGGPGTNSSGYDMNNAGWDPVGELGARRPSTRFPLVRRPDL